jgi:eukaryotic-like serine/threonine-protein kinase
MDEDLIARLHATLAGRYTFERELGRGGTAVVYLAHDIKHDRKVAFKVLLPQVAMAIGAERFQREITIAARLMHPHILALYDSGDAGGLLYYVMPFVRGESLRDRLGREHRLPIDDGLRIGKEVASALSRAHSEGVVHRDIKPENILLEGGYAIVADFGIARAMYAAENRSITQTGLAIGTPTYMSPEQAVGAQDIDGRSDIYSLACVVYEMLAGEPPYHGGSLRELLALHAVAAVPSVRLLRPDVQPHVDAALARALAKDPSDRFPTPEDFADALANAARPERAPGGLAARDGFWARVRSVFTPAPPAMEPPPRPAAGKPRAAEHAVGGPVAPMAPRAAAPQMVQSIPSPIGVPTPIMTTPPGRVAIDSLAVLPFASANEDPDSEYLSDGITESIMNKLAGLSGLRVVPRSVVFRYKGTQMDPSAVAREVKARAVVSGRIIHRGETLVIKAELVDAATESQLWGEQYNRTMSDIFLVQEEMAGEITRSLQVKLSGDEHRELAKRFTENPAAYQAYLRGRHHWNKRTVDGLRTALAHFQQAIDLDPSYALAYTGLADTYNILGYYNNQRPHDAYPKGRAAVLRALAIDPALAEAHASMGYVQVFYDLDWPGAERSFRRAIDLNPKYATAHHWYAWFLFAVERFDQALVELERAQELDPLSLIVNDHLGYALLLAGRTDEALAQLHKTRELDPTFPWTYWRLGNVLFEMKRYDEAIESFQTVAQLTEGGVGLGYVGHACAVAGRPAEAEAVLTRLAALGKRQYVSPLEYALVYAGLGRTDEALTALERAYADRVSDFARVKLLPWPDSVRADPRFSALTAKLGKGGAA